MKSKKGISTEGELFIGLFAITVHVALTWYFWVKRKLKKNVTPKPESESVITDEAFEEELAAASAGNGNGKIVDEPCECEDEQEPIPPDLSAIEEEPITPVTSLPEEPEPPGPAEPETPETDTH